ncbi:MAG: hypothetical protein ABT940_02195 [Alphaproteobacteria bacterium]
MSTAIFDTHAFIKRLTAVGMPEPQAEVLAEEQTRLIGDGTATKADITALRSDNAVMSAELAIIKWMVGGIGFGVLLLVLKSFVPTFGH